MGALCAKDKPTLSGEYATGVPVTKALYIPEPSKERNAEYNQGIPVSKLKKGGLLVDEPTKSKKKNKKNSGLTEYRTGVPMSKKMHISPHMEEKKRPESEPLTKAKLDEAVSIELILQRDDAALRSLKQNLQQRGWCRIAYPSKTNEIIQTAMGAVQKWMHDTQLTEKLTFSRKLADRDGSTKPNPQSEYSYNRIEGFKEGLRILTGEIYKAHYANGKYPDAVRDEILKLNEEFDTLAVQLMKVIYDSVYELADYSQFGSKYDISILNDGKTEGKQFKYSMLDFVNYFNDKEYIERIRADEDDDAEMDEHGNMKPKVLKSEFNVFAHSDPGLFALSFASTNEGLEMYDYSTDEWVAIGLNEGIWWNGKTANRIDAAIKSGEHRVKIDEKSFQPRFTGWYEVSCNKQLKAEVMTEAVQMTTKNDNGTSPDKGDSDVLVPIAKNEYDIGVPMSKIDEEFIQEDPAVVDTNFVPKSDFSGFVYKPTNNDTNLNEDLNDDNDYLIPEFDDGIPMSKSGY